MFSLNLYVYHSIIILFLGLNTGLAISLIKCQIKYTRLKNMRAIHYPTSSYYDMAPRAHACFFNMALKDQKPCYRKPSLVIHTPR